MGDAIKKGDEKIKINWNALEIFWANLYEDDYVGRVNKIFPWQ